MIKAEEAYGKVAALLDAEAVAELERIGGAIEEATKKYTTSLMWRVPYKLHTRIVKMLEDHGYAIVSTACPEDGDDCYRIEISWWKG